MFWFKHHCSSQVNNEKETKKLKRKKKKRITKTIAGQGHSGLGVLAWGWWALAWGWWAWAFSGQTSVYITLSNSIKILHTWVSFCGIFNTLNGTCRESQPRWVLRRALPGWPSSTAILVLSFQSCPSALFRPRFQATLLFLESDRLLLAPSSVPTGLHWKPSQNENQQCQSCPELKN